jgi:TusA-related sulfurtransferase
MKELKSDEVLDCFGLMCPMPIIETSRRIKDLDIGQVLEVHSTDMGILEDMPAWCRQTGQEFLGAEEEGEIIKVFVRKLK